MNFSTKLSDSVVSALKLLIKVYKLTISPFLPNSCRFYPTCSRYSEQALSHHGALRGSWLSIRRICKCHPWNNGGFDPVPKTKK